MWFRIEGELDNALSTLSELEIQHENSSEKNKNTDIKFTPV